MVHIKLWQKVSYAVCRYGSYNKSICIFYKFLSIYGIYHVVHLDRPIQLSCTETVEKIFELCRNGLLQCFREKNKTRQNRK